MSLLDAICEDCAMLEQDNDICSHSDSVAQHIVQSTLSYLPVSLILYIDGNAAPVWLDNTKRSLIVHGKVHV